MRVFFTLCFVLYSTILIYAQPANNDCSGVIDLGTVPLCDKSVVYSNIGATAFYIGTDNQPSCFQNNPPQNDVWFQFTTDSDIVDYVVTIQSVDTGTKPLSGMQFAIYRGACAYDALSINSCAVSQPGASKVNLNLDNLTPNEIYYIRVDNYGGAQNQGEFSLCVEEKAPDVNIDDNYSSQCSGYLYDSGGPNGNYENNEDYEFTICPDSPTNCLSLEFEYFNLAMGDFGGGEIMQFYNGNSVNPDNLISELSDGNQYAGGAVCYKVMADSCLTIKFVSDADITFEGFKAYWECSPDACPTQTPIVVDEGAELETIADYLSSTLVDVVIDTIKCNETAYGTFIADKNTTDLGIESGVILTSGLATNAIGPNTSTSTGGFSNTEGDADLDTLSSLYSNGSLSQDACIIEMDITSYGEKVDFEYIFGSEEYEEFVNTSFTDIFALLVSGPDIVGIPEINNQENLAVLPNGDYIEVNSVNHLQNWEYFRNNSAGQSIEYDGLTSDYLGKKKSLTASFVTQPCSTYHLKFAVADRGDSSFDSGVFISKLDGNKPKIITDFATGLNYFVENCFTPNQDTVIIELPSVQNEDFTYGVIIAGTATQGVDYSMNIPSFITFPAGTTQLKFPIVIFNDILEEGDETILIELTRNVGCAEVSAITETIFIKDQLLVDIGVESDTLIICSGSEISISAFGANNYVWSPFNIFDNPFSETVTLSDTDFEGWVSVEGTVSPFTADQCSDVDSVYILPIVPELTIQPMDTIKLCVGDTITLTAENNFDDSNIVWTNNFADYDFEDPNAAITKFYPSYSTFAPTEIVATGEYAGCVVSDTTMLIVDSYTKPIPNFQDTIVCQGDTIEFLENTYLAQENIQWTPDNVFAETDWGVVKYAQINEKTEFTLYSSSNNNICGDTLEFVVDVNPNEISINQGDSLHLCLGDSIQVNITTNPASSVVNWSPSANVSNPQGKNVYLKPTVSTEYTISSESSNCYREVTLQVTVDSLPKIPIEVIQEKDPYCKGETITFVSPKYNSNSFQNIMHEWTPNNGVQNEVTDLNLALIADVTADYVRTTTNGVCVQRDTVPINVIDPSLEINQRDTSICKNSSLDLNFEANGEVKEIEWSSSPSADIDCDDCEEATLHAEENDLTISVTAEIDGCPTSSQAFIEIINYDGTAKVIEDPTYMGGDVNCGAMYFVGDMINVEALPNDAPADDILYTWKQGNQDQDGNTKIISTEIDTEVDQLSFNDCKSLNYNWSFVDANGCPGQGSVDIKVGRRFAIPNAFSPGSGDEFNDVFRLIDRANNTSNFIVNSFIVYNRWGENVFDCDNPECAIQSGWDGTYKGEDQPGDTYMYYIEIETGDGIKETFKGDLLLMR